MAGIEHDFKETRLEIGLSVLDEERTLYEIAKLQGKPSGSVRGVVRRMVDDEELIPSENPPVQGTTYRVHPDAREALVRAAEGSQKPGSLVKHQRLLTVSGGPGRMEAMATLSSTTLAGAVSWVARINSADEQLVAMNPDADDALVDSLVLALIEKDFEVREGLVAGIMSAAEMRTHNKKAMARAKAAS
jgi:hypothetical protein